MRNEKQKENPLPEALQKDWMTRQEACRQLQCEVTTLWRLRKQGLIESRRYMGRVLIKKSDVRKRLTYLEPAN